MKFLAILAVFLLATAFAIEEAAEIDDDNSIDVVNGTDAARNQFPYQVSLQKRIILILYQHICGGSIISESWVVTAAHCTSKQNKSDLRIVAGILKLSDTIISILVSNVQKVDISEIIIHPGYPGGQVVSKDDISLLKLATSLKYGDNVQAISLGTVNPAAPGNATLSGWGYTNVSDILPSNALQYTTVLVKPNSECKTLLDSLEKNNKFNSTANICSTPQPNGHQAQCSGDSGGPLARNNTLIGIVSWHVGTCGTSDYPSVFVNVAAYVPWINENAK